eukprot:Blabericola_migrator_1__402@NODE_10_length_25093_cov_104_131184_g7_i2_p2_GENE_NODE_10_length_25093_cov_104_131184_g7_i2NODE_10_length_25093_cov_104_131184_g7_i2_p2_ORF_typecomplete_len738_score119_08Fib_alpha/PF08702_10/2_2e03Fib_alpha/PF08702_10/0_11Fez1/PF06818_15/1_1e02Fez1/PF06818_15/12SLX9/PF15341_6/3_9SLX9/PF15341_6/1_2e03SLX9/PF15341_6/6_7e02_NODE_10_length_25093_cov_104_131184_g7_i213163529
MQRGNEKLTGSLKDLQRALDDVREQGLASDKGAMDWTQNGKWNNRLSASPSTLPSTPDDMTISARPVFAQPRTGPMSASLGRIAREGSLLTGDLGVSMKAPATADLCNPAVTGASPAMRSELKALQEGLVRLRCELASRRAKSRELGKPSKLPPMSQGVEQLPDLMKGGGSILDEDGMSQSESVAPTAMHMQLLATIQSLTARLSRLEKMQQDQRPPRSTPVHRLDLQSRPPPRVEVRPDVKPKETETPSPTNLKETSIATLQAELALERSRRIRLEALLRALAPRLGLSVEELAPIPMGAKSTLHMAEKEFDPQVLDSLEYGELKHLIQELSIRSREAIRLHAGCKSKTVELTAALRTVSDLSMRIATMEESTKSDSTEKVEATSNTIGSLSIRVRQQNMRIRALQNELNILKGVCEDACFELVGPSAQKILEAYQSLTPLSPASKGRNGVRAMRSESGSPESPEKKSRISPTLSRGVYQAVPQDPIDAAIEQYINQCAVTPKVLPTRVSPGRYMYGRLAVRGGISASSKIPLIFHNGKKFSLRKFMQLYEDIEWAATRTAAHQHTNPQLALSSLQLEDKKPVPKGAPRLPEAMSPLRNRPLHLPCEDPRPRHQSPGPKLMDYNKSLVEFAKRSPEPFSKSLDLSKPPTIEFSRPSHMDFPRPRQSPDPRLLPEPRQIPMFPAKLPRPQVPTSAELSAQRLHYSQVVSPQHRTVLPPMTQPPWTRDYHSAYQTGRH